MIKGNFPVIENNKTQTGHLGILTNQVLKIRSADLWGPIIPKHWADESLRSTNTQTLQVSEHIIYMWLA